MGSKVLDCLSAHPFCPSKLVHDAHWSISPNVVTSEIKSFFLVRLFTSGTCSEERELIIIDSPALSCLRRRYLEKWEFKMFLQSDLSDHFNTGHPHTSWQRAFSLEQAHTTSLSLQLPVLTIFFNGLTLTVRQNGAVNLNLELGNPRTWAGHMYSPSLFSLLKKDPVVIIRAAVVC